MFKEFGWANKASRTMGKYASKLGISPNAITWMSIVPAIGAMVLAYYHFVFYAIFFFLISGLFDFMDGAVARYTGQTSYLGGFIDGTLDRFVDLAIVIAIYFQYIPSLGLDTGFWLMLLVFFMVLPSFIVAYANHRKAVKDPNETVVWRIIHRLEMFVLFFATLITAKYAPVVASYLLVITVGLCALTTIQSFWLAIAKSKTHRYE